MKVVIDTNIVVSAVIRDRLPERVLLWCIGAVDVEWYVTQSVLNEYLEVIRRPKFALSVATVTWWTELLIADTQIVHSAVHIDFPRDSKDVPFLVCAGSVGADYFITGDRDFSEAQSLVTTRIISASQFAKDIMLI
jgi:putative PIN family toxin of toxin-antitoxin system